MRQTNTALRPEGDTCSTIRGPPALGCGPPALGCGCGCGCGCRGRVWGRLPCAHAPLHPAAAFAPAVPAPPPPATTEAAPSRHEAQEEAQEARAEEEAQEEALEQLEQLALTAVRLAARSGCTRVRHLPPAAAVCSGHSAPPSSHHRREAGWLAGCPPRPAAPTRLRDAAAAAPRRKCRGRRARGRARSGRQTSLTTTTVHAPGLRSL